MAQDFDQHDIDIAQEVIEESHKDAVRQAGVRDKLESEVRRLGGQVQHSVSWGHHIYTPPRRLGLEKIRKWSVYTMPWCKWKLPQNTSVCIYTTTGALRAPMVVYIESVVFFGNWHRH